MANKKVQLKNADKTDNIYPKTQADIVTFNNSGTSILSSNVQDAIVEVASSSGGTTDFTQLTNRPTLNGTTLGQTSFYAPTTSVATSTSKRYLIGSSSTTSVATENTNSNCYMESGYLYSNGKQVLPVSSVNPSSTTSTLTGLTINGTSYAISGGSGGLPTVSANTTISDLASQYPNQWVNVFGTTSSASALHGANGQVYLQVSGTSYKLHGILKVGTNLMNASNITVSNTTQSILVVFLNYAFKYGTLYSTKIELEDRGGYTYYLFYNSTKPQANIPTSSVSDLLEYVLEHTNQYSRDESLSPLFVVYQLQSGQWYSSPASITKISNSYRIRCLSGSSSSPSFEEIYEDDLDSIVSVKTGSMVNG